MAHINAPWTDEEVAAINEWQKKSEVHPFTCDFGHHFPLVAEKEYLTCPARDCQYRQRWVHDFMAGYRQ